MLDRARQRLATGSIDNVELVEAEIPTYQPPPATNAAIATFAIEMRPDYDDIIAASPPSLAPVGALSPPVCATRTGGPNG